MRSIGLKFLTALPAAELALPVLALAISWVIS